MNGRQELPAILIVSHGSPREETNRRFAALVERIAARVGLPDVLATFFSIARPNIPDHVAVLAGRGVRRIVLMPFFLGEGQHVSQDIPAILGQCRQAYPEVAFEMLPTLENEVLLEDLMVERLLAFSGPGEPAQWEPAAIERRSYEIIDRQLASWPPADPGARWIARRVLHATADAALARSLQVHPDAIAQGRAALASGRPVLCDVRMLQAGITKAAGEVLCLIDDEQTRQLAEASGRTRAAEAIARLAPRMEGAIVAVGNAPTALWRVLEMTRAGGPRPAVVVGLPVGVVGARDAKLALLSSDLCYVTNTSNRGGSPAAAAAVNALATFPHGEPDA
jgi:precorrin-8X/cobalt-precorrin-8 methylmutase